MQNSETNGCTAAKSATARKVFFCCARESERATLRALEKQIGSLRDDLSLALRVFRARDRDRIVNAQCNAEAIESRAEVRRARWNADRDLFHKLASFNLLSR